MLIDLLIIVFLLLMNGFFAMAEMAIVSARRPRLRQMAEEKKSKGARLALALAEDPSAYLSAIQIGVTLSTILAGAFSGARMADPLGTLLNETALIAPYGEAVAFALVVGAVSFLTLIVGELVPKRIALAYAEPVAAGVAGIMDAITRAALPVVWVLKASTNMTLRFLNLDGASESAVTEDEIKTLIAEGTEKGVFKPAEKDMIEGVMRLADWSVRTIMTPRIDMMWLGIEDKPQDIMKEIIASGHSRFPVARGDMEEVVGVVYAKDLLNAALTGTAFDLKSLMRPPVFVPDTTSVLRLLEMVKSSGQHLAIVIDEYGSVEGMITVTDILEAITGDLPEAGQDDDEEKPFRRADGSWLVDGRTPIEEVEMLIGVKNLRDGGEFHTIAGFMIDRLGRIPASGDVFMWSGARFEVMDMDGRRVDKVMILPPTVDADEDQEID